MMSQQVIQDGKLRLHDWVEVRGGVPHRVIRSAFVGEQFNEQVVNVIDWRLDLGEVVLTYTTYDHYTAPIFDGRFRMVDDAYPLKAPNKSRFWEFKEYSSEWFNRKTGKRVYVV